jgi:hypothetical protein
LSSRLLLADCLAAMELIRYSFVDDEEEVNAKC